MAAREIAFMRESASDGAIENIIPSNTCTMKRKK
jgi:hypothetical protein